MNSYVVFDFETSDRNSRCAEIVEISALKVVNSEITDKFYTLVKPKGKINPYASAVNGITLDMLVDAPTISTILPAFINFIGDNPLLGYNISSFDIPILRRYVKDLLGFNLSNEYHDVLYMARKRIKDVQNHSLCSVAAYFHLDTTEAHRALHDCYLTKQCYDKLLELPPLEIHNKSTTHKHKSHFSESTKALQTLQSFLLGIIADNELNESEFFVLKNWLENNSKLQGQYPFDRVLTIVSKTLEDGVLEQSELDEMLSLFREYTSPIDECTYCEKDITLYGKILCLTGDFESGTRKQLEQQLTDSGSICKGSVTKQTDYVIVGSLGSSAWSCGNYGSKIKTALEMQSKGSSIKILKEENIKHLLTPHNTSRKDCQPILSDTGDSFSENTFYAELERLLDQIIKEHELPSNSLHLYSNVSPRGKNAGIEISKSICIYEPDYPSVKEDINNQGKNLVVLNIKIRNQIELIIRDSQFGDLEVPQNATIKVIPSDQALVHVYFDLADNSVFNYLESNIRYCIAGYRSKASSFGCCSRFMECSNAGKCVHINKLYATACKYRENLEAGHIFYGPHKNI